MIFYVYSTGMGFYRLMYPLSAVDVTEDSPLVRSLWKQGGVHLQVFLSSRQTFDRRMIEDTVEGEVDDVVLLLSRTIDAGSYSQSFLLTTCGDDDECENDLSHTQAVEWLDNAARLEAEMSGGSILAAMQGAGQGIESTSVLLTLYTAWVDFLQKILDFFGVISQKDLEESQTQPERPVEVRMALNSSLWSRLSSNSTLFIHSALVRTDDSLDFEWPPSSQQMVSSSLQGVSSTNSIRIGRVNLIKFEPPHHVTKPKRILVNDVDYLVRRYVLGATELSPPWHFEQTQPQQHQAYEHAKSMKSTQAGYPYWKPEVSIKLINEEDSYPSQFAGLSGMPLVKVQRSTSHPTGVAFLPGVHVDEIGLTSEKYIPVNDTLRSLPLRISFDRNDVKSTKARHTATAGGMSPARWRLLSHLSEALEAQKALGFEQSDIDDVRRLVADTNVTLLVVTMLFSALHMLFEFLTFKNEVSFWNSNTDLTGLSVQALFLDCFCQSVILLYLIEKESSLLMIIPSGIGCIIALWKCYKATGLTLGRIDPNVGRQKGWWNVIPGLFGFEFQTPRLESFSKAKETESGGRNLAAVSLEADRLATRTLGYTLLPFVAGYTIYSLIYEEHFGWYSWILTSASSAVYTLGFVLMTPQLFLNWKLKSVAHLPWRVLVYKSLNTFIDDLFSFIIRMPTMARISCFRDDLVFFVYLYQRWLYPVDKSRPQEGGSGDDAPHDDLDVKKKQ